MTAINPCRPSEELLLLLRQQHQQSAICGTQAPPLPSTWMAPCLVTTGAYLVYLRSEQMRCTFSGFN